MNILFVFLTTLTIIIPVDTKAQIGGKAKIIDGDTIKIDTFKINGLTHFSKDEDLQLIIYHEDKTTDKILLKHTFNENQIKWFKAGSALNLLAKQNEK